MTGPNRDAENEWAAFVETETRDTYDFLGKILLIGCGTIAALIIGGGIFVWSVTHG